MANGRHIGEYCFGHNSTADCLIYAKFGLKTQNTTIITANWTKIQDGVPPPYWKSLYRPISVKINPIIMKFCVQKQSGTKTLKFFEQNSIFKIEAGGLTPY